MMGGRHEWARTTVGASLVLRYGKPLAKEARDEGGAFPVLGSAGRMSGTHKPLVRGSVVVIGRKGNVGEAHLALHGSWPIDTTYYAEIPDDFDARFLRHQLDHLDLKRLDSSTATPSLRRQDLEAQVLVRPPIAEQWQTVEILEGNLSRLEAAATGLKMADSRAGTMLSAARHRMMLEAQRGPSIHSVGELAAVGTGTTPSRAQARYYDGGAIPWVTSGDLSRGLIENSTQYVTDDALAETSLRLYPAGTLLVAMYGEGKTRGTVGELAVDATINQACAAVQVHDPDLRPWVRAVLDANYLHMRRLAAGGVQPNLNLRLVRALPIPVPGPDVRSRLMADVQLANEAAGSVRSQVNRALTQVAALRRGLLAAAFSGRLTGRSTDAEVIEELAHV